MAELAKGIRLRNEGGLSHLKSAANAGLAIAQFHYHLRLDEQTTDF
jgi:hypothetical protein